MQCFKNAGNLYRFVSKTPKHTPVYHLQTGIWFLAPTQLFLKQQALIFSESSHNTGGSNPLVLRADHPGTMVIHLPEKALAVERLPDFHTIRAGGTWCNVGTCCLGSWNHSSLWNVAKSSKWNYRYYPSWSTLSFVSSWISQSNRPRSSDELVMASALCTLCNASHLLHIPCPWDMLPGRSTYRPESPVPIGILVVFW